MTGNPSRKGTTAYAIHEALRMGGGIPRIRRNALRIFSDTTVKKGELKKKSMALLKNDYLTPAALQKVIEDLEQRGYKVIKKGKGEDIYIRVKDGD